IIASIGAAGGILASFGLISLIGITDPNSVKPMAPIMTLTMAAAFIPGYMQRASCVFPVGVVMAIGSILGALVGSTLSSHYLADMRVFRPVFGGLALLVAAQIFWRALRSPTNGIQAFSPQGIQTTRLSWQQLSFVYGEKIFRIPPGHPLLAGFFIAMIAALFGVGGGFLLVPFMASFLGMPMYIVPATAAIPIFIGGSISVTNYLRLGAEPDFPALGVLVVSGMLGALFGPHINGFAQEKWLQVVLAVIITLIGLKYVLGL
ncbi:MAG: sulfite exporter TauE/SafE family protein, partial [Thiothrix litoralis]